MRIRNNKIRDRDIGIGCVRGACIVHSVHTGTGYTTVFMPMMSECE